MLRRKINRGGNPALLPAHLDSFREPHHIRAPPDESGAERPRERRRHGPAKARGHLGKIVDEFSKSIEINELHERSKLRDAPAEVILAASRRNGGS
jgi:hypothetical protein